MRVHAPRLWKIEGAIMSNVSPLDILAVKNVISLYCEALDAKDFALLKKVFLQDVTADYPFRSDLQGVDRVANAIKIRYLGS